jgi:hypothetical protein
MVVLLRGVEILTPSPSFESLRTGLQTLERGGPRFGATVPEGS